MRKKLLLADDSITIQKVIGIIFATEDYELVVCDDGDEAFKKSLDEYPDLVIADVSMPGKDGFELCEAIKAESRLAHTSVLLLPGTFDHFDESRAEAVGADGWISKPFESQALLDKVAQLIDAEPVRVSAAEETPVEESVDFSAEEVSEEVATDVVEEASEPQTGAVDEVVLGLDEVDELQNEVAESSVAEESADDIWDAVSFEEEDLQQAEDLAPAVETDLAEEFVAAEDVVETPIEEALESEGEVVLEDDGQPLELTDEVSEEPGLDEALELESSEGELLELEDDSIVSATETDASAPLDDVVLEEEFEDDLSIVEPLDEDDFEGDEEVLDLAEGDILEEESAGAVAAEQPAEVAPELVVADAEEEAFVLDDEPVSELEKEPELTIEPEAEATEDGGFYYDASEPEKEELPVESVAAVTAGVAVAAVAEPPSVEQVEQQLRELSEDELKEVVAKVAGPTIEKLANEMLEQIVWEVVPDLAESMIREEIRKIRQGAE